MPLYNIIGRARSRAASAPRGRSILTAGSLISLFSAIVGCNPNNALKISEPDNINSSTVNTAAALPALLNGTFSAFQIAYSGAADENNGGHEGYINLTGLFTDELEDLETFPTRKELDGRLAAGDNSSLKAYFIDLTSARAIADKADSKYNTFAPDSAGHGSVLALGGYTYIMFAEGYCEGVPVSTLNDNGSITYGQPLTREQLLQIAIQRFDSAITVATKAHDANTLMLAQVGLGRALLDSNDDAGAAAAVASVPVNYVFDIGASTNTAEENNGIWMYTVNLEGFSVSDTEGTNGLPFVSANDPRVPTINTGGPGVSGIGIFIQQNLYPTQSSLIPLATGVEAQLIIAEHQLRTSGPGGPYFATLNALRATEPGLAPIAVAPATADSAQNLLFSERAFWMYLTGHRLGDLRRLVRQYGRPVNSVFPIGIDFEGAPYGPDVNFEVSQDEANNPNFHGCLNRSA
jgi:starch-binding outer membrane protein, SusD/RagB family